MGASPDDSSFFNIEGQGQERDSCIPIFKMETVEDAQATIEAGHKKFKEVPFVEIIVPGGKDVVNRRVTEKDKQRWPQQWHKFEQGKESTIDGCPIEQWPLVDRITAAELKAFNILSVESFVECGPDIITKLGPGMKDMQEKAKLWLASSKEDSPIYKQKETIDDLKSQLTDAQDLIKALTAENKKLKAAAKKAGGAEKSESEAKA